MKKVRFKNAVKNSLYGEGEILEKHQNGRVKVYFPNAYSTENIGIGQIKWVKKELLREIKK